MPLVLVQQAAAARSPGSSEYGQLLGVLDDAAAREIDACLASLPVLTEPHIARELSRVLPAGVVGPSCACRSQSGSTRIHAVMLRI
jgi:hypothetical protein